MFDAMIEAGRPYMIRKRIPGCPQGCEEITGYSDPWYSERNITTWLVCLFLLIGTMGIPLLIGLPMMAREYWIERNLAKQGRCRLCRSRLNESDPRKER